MSLIRECDRCQCLKFLFFDLPKTKRKDKSFFIEFDNVYWKCSNCKDISTPNEEEFEKINKTFRRVFHEIVIKPIEEKQQEKKLLPILKRWEKTCLCFLKSRRKR